MSRDEGCSQDQLASLQPPGAYANKVYLNLIDGLVRISFGLKAGDHTRYTEAVTVTPGLALALRDLINTYVPTPAPTPPTVAAEPKRVEKPVDLARLRPRTGDRSTPH